MGLKDYSAAIDVGKKILVAAGKWAIAQYKKSKATTTVGILFQTKDGKWNVQYVDMILNQEMQKEINSKLTDAADGKITQAEANKTVARRLQVHRKDKPAFNKNFTLNEWTPDLNLAFSSGQMIPLSEITKTQLVSQEGYKVDYSKAYICSAPVAVAFNKINAAGLDAMKIMQTELKYDKENGFETPKQFKDATKKNLKFIKGICKKNNISFLKNVDKIKEAIQRVDDLNPTAETQMKELKTSINNLMTKLQNAKFEDKQQISDDLDLDELDLDLDDYVSEAKLGMNDLDLSDEDFDIEGDTSRSMFEKHQRGEVVLPDVFFETHKKKKRG